MYRWGHLKAVELLLDAGAAVAPVDLGRNTPLHLAARKGHTEVVRVLVNAGSPVELVNFRHVVARVCCAVLCCAVLCCAVLCCAVLCCAVLCCAGVSFLTARSLKLVPAGVTAGVIDHDDRTRPQRGDTLLCDECCAQAVAGLTQLWVRGGRRGIVYCHTVLGRFFL